MTHIELLGRTQIFTNEGSGDMGSLTVGQTLGSPPGTLDTNESARWPKKDEMFIPLFIRVHFVDGSGTADMDINIDSGDGPRFDMSLHTVKAVGTGNDVNWYLEGNDLHGWMLGMGDRLVLTWTNPDSGTMLWGATAGLLIMDPNNA